MERLGGDGANPMTWSVGYWSYRETINGKERAYQRDKVEAESVEIVEGALVFRDADGDLIRAFGPTGWDEVEQATEVAD